MSEISIMMLKIFWLYKELMVMKQKKKEKRKEEEEKEKKKKILMIICTIMEVITNLIWEDKVMDIIIITVQIFLIFSDVIKIANNLNWFKIFKFYLNSLLKSFEYDSLLISTIEYTFINKFLDWSIFSGILYIFSKFKYIKQSICYNLILSYINLLNYS